MFQLFTAKFQRFLSLHNSNYFGTLCNAALQRLTCLFGSKRTNLRALGCQRQRNIRNLICKLCDFFSYLFLYLLCTCTSKAFLFIKLLCTDFFHLLILCIMAYWIAASMYLLFLSNIHTFANFTKISGNVQVRMIKKDNFPTQIAC